MPDHTSSLHDAVKDDDLFRRWVRELRAVGVKAAHPDDGWVNRNENSFLLVNPQFNLGVGVGDLVALGTQPHEYTIDPGHRIVRVIRIDEKPAIFEDGKICEYFFEEVATTPV